MLRKRVSLTCKVCGEPFEVRPCEIKCYATCSKLCSLKYRSIVHTGREHNYGDKLSAALRGKPHPWMKDLAYRKKMSELALQNKAGTWNRGKKQLPENVEKRRLAQIGHHRGGWKFTEETRRKLSLARRGDKTNFWCGGVGAANEKVRHSFEYKEWRRKVFERDNFTCQTCGVRGGVLNADHIKPFALFPELRFEIDNGRTLCKACHLATPTHGKPLHKLKTIHGIDVNLIYHT